MKNMYVQINRKSSQIFLSNTSEKVTSFLFHMILKTTYSAASHSKDAKDCSSLYCLVVLAAKTRTRLLMLRFPSSVNISACN